MVCDLLRADKQFDLRSVLLIMGTYVNQEGHTIGEFEDLLRSLGMQTRCYARPLTPQEKRDYLCLAPSTNQPCDLTVVAACRPRDKALQEVLAHNPDGLIAARARLADAGFLTLREGASMNPKYDTPL
jgi:hypothetical protein